MERNEIFETAADFVNNTGRSIFLTGKAGTGKTTFLKYIKEHTSKKCVVVAPTGVAAIHAGGVTMHSFFQLPMGPYVPVTNRISTEGVTDKHLLFKNIRLSAEKRELLRDLELLIIDEVSMVRCDTLDAMDAILRAFRRRPDKPFGGVQVLFIGDLFQLPPVMPDNEWAILREHYTSPFFFHARVIEQAALIFIELKKIYRQNEQRFIEVLNRVRNNEVNADDLAILNARHKAPLVDGRKYIVLTSHNYKADRINQEALSKLPGKLYDFKGTIEGDFPEKALPTDMTLQLKEGSQVMFIRNDTNEEKRYFNGKIALVSRIDDEGVTVTMDEGSREMRLEKGSWDNIRYSYNQADEKIDEEKLGSFSQYPIRLAWAITIHKSQGLTFEHAIIDAGDSFAPGQVYVALSRCVSLEGMVLHSKIEAGAIATHNAVIDFGKNEHHHEVLQRMLDEDKLVYANALLIETFDLQNLIESLGAHVEYTQGKKSPKVQEATSIAKALLAKVEEFQKVAVKFKDQLESLLRENNHDKLKERVSKAIEYFAKGFNDDILKLLDDHISSLKGVSKVKQYLKRIRAVKLHVTQKIHSIQNARLGDLLLNISEKRISVEDDRDALKQVKAKTVKGDSLKETLGLFKANASIAAVAQQRGLAISTVESHISTLIRMGEVDVADVVSQEKLDQILKAIKETKVPSLTNVKLKLGDDFSFGEVRAVMKHLEFLQSKK